PSGLPPRPQPRLVTVWTYPLLLAPKGCPIISCGGGEIGQAASADLPNGHATLYRPGELERLVADLEMRVRRPSQEEIARRAYEIFEHRGRVHGYDLDDWLQAERELRGQ
ncbi:MAG: DUF2934 domain-containing protein, partial [Vicinamibacterales bacterium]